MGRAERSSLARSPREIPRRIHPLAVARLARRGRRLQAWQQLPWDMDRPELLNEGEVVTNVTIGSSGNPQLGPNDSARMTLT